jgi:hypothetical protein
MLNILFGRLTQKEKEAEIAEQKRKAEDEERRKLHGIANLCFWLMSADFP